MNAGTTGAKPSLVMDTETIDWAIDFFLEQTDQVPATPAFWNRMAVICYSAGRHVDALHCLSESEALAPALAATRDLRRAMQAPPAGVPLRHKTSLEGRPLSWFESRLYNDAERLIPGVTHPYEEDVRHYSSYAFYRAAIEADRAASRETGPFTIADLGCGVGHGSSVLAGIPGAVVTSVDLEPACIRYAKVKYARPNITFGQADLMEFIPRMPAFDYVVSRHAMEHLPGGLEPCHRVRFKRRFIFEVPYDEAEGANHYHTVNRIKEGHFAGFPGAELLYQDFPGSIHGVPTKPGRAIGILCAVPGPGMPPIASRLPLPFLARAPDYR